MSAGVDIGDEREGTRGDRQDGSGAFAATVVPVQLDGADGKPSLRGAVEATGGEGQAQTGDQDCDCPQVAASSVCGGQERGVLFRQLCVIDGDAVRS